MHKPGAEAGTIRNHDVLLGTQWRPIAGVKALQVCGDCLGIGLDQEHEGHARDQYRWHQQPGQRCRVEAQRSRDSLGGTDQERSAQRTEERAGENVAQALGASLGQVRIRGGRSELLAGSHSEPKDQYGCDEHRERAPQHRQAHADGADEAERQTQQQAHLAAALRAPFESLIAYWWVADV